DSYGGSGGPSAQGNPGDAANGFGQQPSPPPGMPGAPGTTRGTANATGTAGAGAPSGGGPRVTSDEINNAVIVYATPREYAVVEDALR
ncbi:hypothetical protein, partial [Pseudomonas aeruginosa]